jgi:hypothetical protein
MQNRDQVAIAALVIGLLIGAAATYALAAASPGRTITTTTTLPAVTSTGTATVTAIQQIANVGSIPLHKVTFNESGDCGGVYADPWAVTMGNITISQPSNMTYPFPPSVDESDTAAAALISKIVFTVPDGTYNYTTYAPASLFPFSGTVDVNGSDVVVQLQLEIGCMAY